MTKVITSISNTKYLLPMHPIVYITTVSNSGVDNGAVFATCMDTSYNPPQVTFASAIHQHNLTDSAKTGGLESEAQDTLRNITMNKMFIVNIPGYELAKHMNILAYPYEHGVDEISKAGLTKISPFTLNSYPNYPKIIAECLAHLECELVPGGLNQPDGSDHALITGKVVGASYDEKLGSTIEQARKHLISEVFGQLGASPNKDCRYLGKITRHELKETLVFESERK